MSYKATGKVYKIFDTEQKTSSFQARDFVIEMQDGQYPQLIKFQLAQDKCSLVDGLSEGDEVEVDFDLRGREWNDKYFTNLQAWRVTTQNSTPTNPPAPAAQASQPAAQPVANAVGADFDDDIPF